MANNPAREVNALKERQRLQETLLAALQDPQRWEAALSLLETENPVARVEALFPKNELDAQHGEVDSFDNGGSRTLSSPDPSPDMVQMPSARATSDILSRVNNMSTMRSDSVVSSIASGSDYFSSMSECYTSQMNPLAMNINPPLFNQFGQPFGSSNAEEMLVVPFLGPGTLGNLPAPVWLDPSLNARDNDFSYSQQQNPPLAQQPGGNMASSDSSSDDSSIKSMMGDNAGIMTARGGPHQIPHPSNLFELGQRDHLKLAWSTLEGPPNQDSPSSMPSADSVPSLTMWGASSLLSKASFEPSPSGPSKRQRASISSAVSVRPQPRSMSRERHRLALARSWYKERQATVDLQIARQRVEAQHAMLTMEYIEVLNEVQQMKHALLGHAGCNDSAIKMWLKREADGVLTEFQQPDIEADLDMKWQTTPEHSMQAESSSANISLLPRAHRICKVFDGGPDV
ncbi:hypothetical protein B0T11DRAFT_298913 [Plectosphaerella cucumerina]|uniref:BZIP domain-containing protein n=1 Tax=Plectosphaerella cucumerina TaxID=40658 RepID=A0A8K0T9X2_9PEZI|nr:hypothetical protein B0T11DRAFT_298913 [Plectosphaerella cucumerina]